MLNAKYDAEQKRKDKWKSARLDALEYYKGSSLPYTMNYFDDTLFDKVPAANINVTKRIIDRVSLVYMKPPKRIYTNEDTPLLFHHKDFKLQRAERMTNLLDGVLRKVCMRYGDKNEQHIEYDIIHDYEPMFGDDPLTPIAFTYPIASKDSVLDDTGKLYVYWDAENTFTYDENGKIYTDEDNPDMINPYGVLPFVFIQPVNIVDEFWNEGAMDICVANRQVDIAMTMLQHHIRSAGGQWVVEGRIDANEVELGVNKILAVEGGRVGNLAKTVNMESIMSGIICH